MVAAIIDNSTLTAVQRLTGNIVVGGAYDPEGDIAAFEQFLTGILFYDNLYYVDDYKDQHKDDRRNFFAYLTALPSNGSLYNRLQAASIAGAARSVLSFRGVEAEANEVGQFLTQIGLHLSAAWVMRSSDFFLNLRVLADEDDGESPDKYKYSPLTSAIFHQISGLNGKFDDRAVLVSYDGRSIEEIVSSGGNKKGVSEQLAAFSASINWLTRRTIFYTLAANHYEFDFLLHPIRHSFLVNYLAGQGEFSGPSVPARVIEAFFQEGRGAVTKVNQDTADATFILDLPWFSAWLVGEVGSPSQAISRALEIRDDPELIEIRAILSEIRKLQNSGDILGAKREANRVIGSLRRKMSRFVARFGGLDGTSTGMVAMSMSFSGPSVGPMGSARDIMDDKFSNKRIVGTFIRNIAKDIAGYNDLGRVRARLRSEIRRSSDKYVPVFEADAPKFRLARPYWKEPF